MNMSKAAGDVSKCSCRRASESTDVWERAQFQQPHQTLGEVQGLLGQGAALNKPKPRYRFRLESTASEIVMLLPPFCGVLSACSLCCFRRKSFDVDISYCWQCQRVSCY
jgi:hypothetical protein